MDHRGRSNISGRQGNALGLDVQFQSLYLGTDRDRTAPNTGSHSGPTIWQSEHSLPPALLANSASEHPTSQQSGYSPRRPSRGHLEHDRSMSNASLIGHRCLFPSIYTRTQDSESQQQWPSCTPSVEQFPCCPYCPFDYTPSPPENPPPIPLPDGEYWTLCLDHASWPEATGRPLLNPQQPTVPFRIPTYPRNGSPGLFDAATLVPAQFRNNANVPHSVDVYSASHSHARPRRSPHGHPPRWYTPPDYEAPSIHNTGTRPHSAQLAVNAHPRRTHRRRAGMSGDQSVPHARDDDLPL